MLERALFVLVLSSSSFSRASTFSPLSTCSLSCSSTSMRSEPPRNKTTALTHNEEYCPVAMHNPLTLIAVSIWKGYTLIADLEELEKMNASDIYPRRINAKEVLIRQKRRWIQIPDCIWYSKIVRKRLRIPNTHSKAVTDLKEWRSQWRKSWRIGRVSTCTTNRWRWSPF